ncbi:Transposase [Wolbachia endosymbiont of Armadillidium vulgare]|nr:Transposase [Wolbachia endosymbiont of Armadillidium vulgare]OJH32427.1 Transposase [Wolbachia endosymbiont of Armadillidium vulgare]
MGNSKTLENTGKYELGLSNFLIDKNITVHRANTRKVKSFILSHGTLAKSDKSDARALAQYGFERHRTLSLFVPTPKKQTTLIALCQRRYANESSRKMQTRSTGK